MNYRQAVLDELREIWDEQGPHQYKFAHLLKCFKPGDEALLVAINQLIAERLILQAADDANRLAIALNPEKLSETPLRPPHDHHVTKLVALVVLLVAGLLGFYVLELPKAALWLMFVVIAIPPVLAVIFEGGKLSGANVLEMYRLGLRGLPLLGRLVGK